MATMNPEAAAPQQAQTPPDDQVDITVMVAVEPSEEDRQREARRVQALDDIGQSLERHKNEAVTWRLEFEQQWSDDYQQYNAAGQRLAETKQQRGGIHTGNPPSSDEQYRSTNDNITRPKVIITAARLGDMLFPTNDSNWTLEASPKPDLPEELIPAPPPGPVDEQTGEQAPGQWTPEALATAIKTVAADRAEAMRVTIDDQLSESCYAEHGRATIFDACLYGTGVLRGPILRTRVKHKWTGGYNAQMVKQAKPSADPVDLWSFYPQPSRNIQECEHVFLLHVMTPSQVRRLTAQPGFDRDQIRRLLSMQPEHGTLASSALYRGVLRPDANIVLSNKYTIWEYQGPMPKTAFAAFMSGLAAQGLISDDEAREFADALMQDEMQEIDCNVWMCQGVVLKMALSTMAPGELGFYVFNYEDNPNSIFGYGVPFLCRDDQQAANQLWHAIMLNSMMSAGPQIGVRAGSLMPMTNENGVASKSMSLSATKPRVWALNDEITDIREALSVFVIPNVTAPLMGVYERAKANADEHTMTPMIAQGEPSQAVPTSSGMAMIMNAANVVPRRLAKQWDDRITVPLIGNFYDWNMAFNPDESVKGDYCVIPKGASHLLIKDVQAQHIQFATTLFSGNAVLQPYMKAGQFARKNIEMLDIAPSDMLYTDEEVAQNQQAQGEQPNPEVIKAQASQMHAEASAKKADTEAQSAVARMDFDKWERQLAHDERMADIQARRDIQAMQVESQQLALAHKMAEMDKDERIQMEKIVADLRKHDSKLEIDRYKTDVNARLGAEKTAQTDNKLAAELQVEAPNVRIQ